MRRCVSLDRSVLREKLVNDNDYFERMKIGVVPLCQGAGATLVATSTSKLLSGNKNIKVTFVEIVKEKDIGSKYTYDSLGIDKRFAGRNFNDLFQLNLLGKTTRGITNIDDGINWILHKPKVNKTENKNGKESNTEGNFDNYRIINNAPGDVIICDFEIHSQMMELLPDMDALIVVIDPMPSSLLAGFQTLAYCKSLEEKGHRIFWVVNKYNGGINRRELHQFLKLKELHYIPFIKADELYSAEYNCMLPVCGRQIKIALENTLNKIIKSIFG
ncbi:MAG: hypothetical protein JJE49_01135 [Peptostreptococcaceae bacterium]|nr:hypothetical protein [Peptostreptococcaceae bacterium]